MTKTITLAHGNGGKENEELIREIFYRAFDNPTLARSEDAALIDEGGWAMTTDSFTVSPLFFPGGDIGKLSIHGTCNDLAMMGARPRYLTCGIIIEEGFATRDLQKIVRSMQVELAHNGAQIISGDTKVVPKGSVDGLFINTTGIGSVEYAGLSAHALKEGMAILISRDIGRHGATIFAAREGIGIESGIESDCASLFPQVEALIAADIPMIALRDATRGGVAAVLNEWATASTVCIEVDEATLPVSAEVQGICEMLGFEATNLANEGTFLLAVETEATDEALAVLRTTHTTAAHIGTVTAQYPGRVILRSAHGTRRFLDLPTGELLPRIC